MTPAATACEKRNVSLVYRDVWTNSQREDVPSGTSMGNQGGGMWWVGNTHHVHPDVRTDQVVQTERPHGHAELLDRVVDGERVTT